MRDYTGSQPADCGNECAAKDHGDWPPPLGLIWGKKTTREQAKPRNECAKKDRDAVPKQLSGDNSHRQRHKT